MPESTNLLLLVEEVGYTPLVRIAYIRYACLVEGRK